MSDSLMFLGTLIVAYTIPGPDMIFLLQTGAAQGRRQALAATVGLGGARACHVVFAAVGLAALFRTTPWLFATIRFVGAAYLIWLGIDILRARSLVPERDPAAPIGGRRNTRVVTRGFLTNLLNPKPLIFCSVLLPQFVQPGAGPILAQFALLGAILVFVGFLFDATFALWGAALGGWLARRPAVQAGQRYGFASVLIGFGAELMVMRAPH
ncbi:LysE family translocator [Acidisoma cellulosilytica]|uniref:LysE family translocator n=1 Tax=Acidisoma cellulosilyticum TaxID=2802395 RepID=A0A963Z5A6_9PROT|nr:LysE family translocator [Acidisoma cellulosilyticum]MCB8882087.1 LysE family translocator [Acidisoma cellulosilyticum]